MKKLKLFSIAALLMLAASWSFGAELVRISAAEAQSGHDHFAKLFDELHIQNQPWAQIKWTASVTDARRQALAEQKPIFLVVNTGNCLGRV
jgi:hypothetical protein